jgi:hypothetical protein
LYNRDVWHDNKTVNVIAAAALLPQSKISSAAVKFFLQYACHACHACHTALDTSIRSLPHCVVPNRNKAFDDESDDDDDQATDVYKQTLQANERNKKTGKRKRKLKAVRYIRVQWSPCLLS